MTETILIAGYIACGIAAYFILRADWLRNFDLRRSDRTFILIYAVLGPIGLLISVLVWIAGCGDGSGRADEIIARRKREK